MKKSRKSHLLLLWVAMSALSLLAATSAEMPEPETSVQKDISQPDITASAPMAIIDVDISGPRRGNNSDVYTWTCSASGGTAPYTYFWEYSIGAQLNPFVSGTGTSQTANMPLDFDLLLRVTATDANGQQAVGTLTVRNISSNPHPGGE